jgi:hypothetical protein
MYRTISLKPTQDVLTLKGIKDKKIRIYPRVKTSEQCLNKSQSECVYPCDWNTSLHRCFDLPFGGYNPAITDIEVVVVGDEYIVE